MLQDRLRLFRGEVGISQEEASRVLGVSYSTYKNWERGVNAPSMDMVQPLCKLFSITPMQLLGWNNDTQTTKVKL